MMTIFVDDMLRQGLVRSGDRAVSGRWSNLMAEDPKQLRWICARLGLQRSWLRFPGTVQEHFIVTSGVREAALRDGAVPLVWEHETNQFYRARRAGVQFDIELLRTDFARFEASLVPAGAVAEAGHPRRARMTPGVALPAQTVSVASPTRWANPYRPADRSMAAGQTTVEHFAGYLRRNPTLVAEAREQLVGHNLACWCPLRYPCHADVWLAMVNESSAVIQGRLALDTLPGGRFSGVKDQT